MAFTQEIVDFTGLTDSKIRTKLEKLNIPLTVEETLKIQNDMLGRAPSLAELILFSIQGSEHCSYKSSRTHLKQFTTDGPDVVLGAKEDAGVVAVATDNDGHRWCVVMSHESHNHPSQIVPYEGAATGVGGNVRDVMCMGAEVIACTDSFRFGDINSNKTKWIHDGVVAGIAGYGNPLGIPNIGGDLYYHDGYNENCLVTLVTLGIVREDQIIHSYAPKNADGYDLILIGKPTDNSGFGGASFASVELEEAKKDQNKGAVQEPNAFLERHLLKSTYALFDILKEKGLIDNIGFKDLGAGGVACASIELAETSGYGAEVWMDKVHIGMDNLHPSVYLCSETQERFMWVSPPEITSLILEHYNKVFDLPGVSEGAQASVIGKIRENGQYIVHNGDDEIVNAPAPEITEGFLYNRPYEARMKNCTEPNILEPTDYNKVLLDNKEVISYDYLTIASGSVSFFPRQIKNIQEYAADIKNIATLQDYKEKFFNLLNTKKQNKNVAIVGGGLSGVEIALEMSRKLKSKNIKEDECKISLIEQLPNILPNMDPYLVANTEKACNDLNVKRYHGAFVNEVKDNTVFLSDDRKVDFDLIFFVIGVTSEKLVSNENIEINIKNQIVVDEYLRIKMHNNVFAVGDIAQTMDENGNFVLPTAQMAKLQAKLTAKNILNTINKKPLLENKLKTKGLMIDLSGMNAVGLFLNLKVRGLIAYVLKRVVSKVHTRIFNY